MSLRMEKKCCFSFSQKLRLSCFIMFNLYQTGELEPFYGSDTAGSGTKYGQTLGLKCVFLSDILLH